LASDVIVSVEFFYYLDAVDVCQISVAKMSFFAADLVALVIFSYLLIISAFSRQTSQSVSEVKLDIGTDILPALFPSPGGVKVVVIASKTRGEGSLKNIILIINNILFLASGTENSISYI